MNYTVFAALAGSYLIGSVPIGYIIARFLGKDIRLHGSGSIGATNMARIFGRIFFVPILFFDACKAYGAVYIGTMVAPVTGLLCGGVCLLGNLFPIFLCSFGGKGVATILGIVSAISPLTAIGFTAIWLSALSIFSRAGIASVTALLALAPLAYYFDCSMPQCILLSLVSFASIARHYHNIVAFVQP